MARIVAFFLITLSAAVTAQGTDADNYAHAYFAGGCFWCTEADFEKLDGVIDAVSGFTGGHVENPSYNQVVAGGTGHVEAVKVIYDPAIVGYDTLLHWHWQHIDPTDDGGQFVDRGAHYRSAIFYRNEDEKQAAEASKQLLEAQGPFEAPIVTEILPFSVFYRAEDHHQDYYQKNPLRYRYYRFRSGRDQFLDQYWQDVSWPPTQTSHDASPSEDTAMWSGGEAFQRPSDAVLKQQLSHLSYRVTREDATERPFQNSYWDHWEDGIYVDVISGEPLFASRDKYKSGTGWPSFTQPLNDRMVTLHEDRSLWMVRTEVRSRYADSHLGHVFDDGPAPTGQRWCMNSAAMRFVAKADMASQGYADWLDAATPSEHR